MVIAVEIREKLDIFYRAAMDAANRQSEAILDEQKQTYQREMSDYEEQKKKDWQEKKRQRETSLKREANRIVQEEMMQQKQAYHSAVEAKKQELFTAVEQRLVEYRHTDAYDRQLEKMVQKAVSLAGTEEAEIYLSPSDEEKRKLLEQRTRQRILIGKEEFGGGIRAVIKGKNILLDESFDRRLQEKREQYEI